MASSTWSKNTKRKGGNGIKVRDVQRVSSNKELLFALLLPLFLRTTIKRVSLEGFSYRAVKLVARNRLSSKFVKVDVK